MTLEWDWDREYHVGRKDGAFYFLDGSGKVLKGPFARVEFSHVGFADNDHIRTTDGDGDQDIYKGGHPLDAPTNLTMKVKIE